MMIFSVVCVLRDFTTVTKSLLLPPYTHRHTPIPYYGSDDDHLHDHHDFDEHSPPVQQNQMISKRQSGQSSLTPLKLVSDDYDYHDEHK